MIDGPPTALPDDVDASVPTQKPNLLTFSFMLTRTSRGERLEFGAAEVFHLRDQPRDFRKYGPQWPYYRGYTLGRWLDTIDPQFRVPLTSRGLREPTGERQCNQRTRVAVVFSNPGYPGFPQSLVLPHALLWSAIAASGIISCDEIGARVFPTRAAAEEPAHIAKQLQAMIDLIMGPDK